MATVLRSGAALIALGLLLQGGVFALEGLLATTIFQQLFLPLGCIQILLALIVMLCAAGFEDAANFREEFHDYRLYVAAKDAAPHPELPPRT